MRSQIGVRVVASLRKPNLFPMQCVCILAPHYVFIASRGTCGRVRADSRYSLHHPNKQCVFNTCCGLTVLWCPHSETGPTVPGYRSPRSQYPAQNQDSVPWSGWRSACAKLCRKNGGDLEQIKFLLGHERRSARFRFASMTVQLPTRPPSRSACRDSLSRSLRWSAVAFPYRCRPRPSRRRCPA
jgi:hypothetical protein